MALRAIYWPGTAGHCDKMRKGVRGTAPGFRDPRVMSELVHGFAVMVCQLPMGRVRSQLCMGVVMSGSPNLTPKSRVTLAK
jgi:hypothetical protein